MIADYGQTRPALGSLEAALHDADTFRKQVIVFIERELPSWRDLPERPSDTDEPRLNEYLCDHLDCAARKRAFDVVRFTLEPVHRGTRRGDIAVKPCRTIIVGSRTYHNFEQILPIECKRLPTPPGRDRNDLEYVH